MNSATLTWRAVLVAAVLSCSAVLVGACSPSPPAPEVTPSRTDLPSPGGADERARVTAAYERFWSVSRPLAALTPEEWESQLRLVAVDPQRTQLLESFRNLRDRNIQLYGQVVPHVSSVEVNGDQARVSDCQDASQAGQADAVTGARKTVGVPRNPVSARLVREGADWKVAEIVFPDGSC